MSVTINIPKNLLVYYGYPSLINSASGNVTAAATEFSAYKVVVLGAGLEVASHPDNANTVAIINHALSVNTAYFGYIDATTSLDTLQTSIDLWAAMGVKGIFCDKFGYDYAVSRSAQRQLVWSIHTKVGTDGQNLKAFVNAWNVDDVFSSAVQATYNPLGLATRVAATDYYLAESYSVINGAYDDADSDSNNIKDWQDKAAKMVTYNTSFGTNMCTVATLGSATFSQALVDYSYFATVLNNFQYYGFGEQFYSASSCNAPFRTRKPFYGTKFTGPVSINTATGVYQRPTNVGIEVDTAAHTTDTITV